MKKFNIQPNPQEGRYYRVIVDGYKQGILKYNGPTQLRNHCKTCTCVDNTPLYTLIEGDTIGAGPVYDIRLIEEVKWPK